MKVGYKALAVTIVMIFILLPFVFLIFQPLIARIIGIVYGIAGIVMVGFGIYDAAKGKPEIGL